MRKYRAADMRIARHTGIHLLIAAIGVLVTLGPTAAQAQWRQWGGPRRNFTAQTKKLADKWPKDGPKKLWRRRLGTGFSAIVVDDGVLNHRAGNGS